MKKISEENVRVDPYYGEPIDPRADGTHLWALLFFGVLFLFTGALVISYYKMAKGPSSTGREEVTAMAESMVSKPDLMEALRYANGGMPNLKDLHTKTMSGTVSREGEDYSFEIHATNTGDAHIRLTDTQGNSTTYTFTGNKAWLNRFVEDRVVEVSPAITPESEAFKLNCEILNPALAHAVWEEGAVLEIEPNVRVYGIDTLHVKVSHQRGRIISDLYIDPTQTRVIKRIDHSQDGREIMERVYTDYRRIRGIDQPGRVLQTLPDQSQAEWTFENVAYNAPNSLSFYVRPDESGPYEEVQLSAFDPFTR